LFIFHKSWGPSWSPSLLFVSLGMKIKDLIERLNEFNPESEIEFVGLVEYGYGEQMEIVSEECHIQEEDGFVQFIISGESLDQG